MKIVTTIYSAVELLLSRSTPSCRDRYRKRGRERPCTIGCKPLWRSSSFPFPMKNGRLDGLTWNGWDIWLCLRWTFWLANQWLLKISHDQAIMPEAWTDVPTLTLFRRYCIGKLCPNRNGQLTAEYTTINELSHFMGCFIQSSLFYILRSCHLRTGNSVKLAVTAS